MFALALAVLAVYGPSRENPIVNAWTEVLRTARVFPARCPVEAGADDLALFRGFWQTSHPRCQNQPHVGARVPGAAVVVAEHRVNAEPGALEAADHLRN
jgi:hypothetical protein